MLAVPGANPIHDGWRRIIDFGERWTEDDRDLAWPPGAGKVPIGESLVYGCEVSYPEPPSPRVRVRFISVDHLRPIMMPGAQFTLRDGASLAPQGASPDFRLGVSSRTLAHGGVVPPRCGYGACSVVCTGHLWRNTTPGTVRGGG